MKIVHKNKDPYDVYVGRPSRWGNPYKVGVYSLETCLAMFARDVRNDIAKGRSFEELEGITLACWSPPKGGITSHGPLI